MPEVTADRQTTSLTLPPRGAGRLQPATGHLPPAPPPGVDITYYGTPSLKASPWKWHVGAYLFVAGVSGAAQVLSLVAGMVRGRKARSVVRNGRYMGLAGSLIGAPLLIADLHTPDRWYNMLRIFRSTSPMSIGSYLLTAFGAFSGVSALGQFVSDMGWRKRAARRVAWAAHVPAAAAGAGMSVYTASLLSATSSPLWAAATRLLAIRFGSSAIASGAAALSLAERARGDRDGNARRLDAVAFLATISSLVATMAANRRYRAYGVDSPLRDEPAIAAKNKLGASAVGQVLPLACYGAAAVSKRDRPDLSAVASLAVIAGSYFLRSGIIHAGMASSERPADALRFARRPSVARGNGSARIEHWKARHD